ncbi:YfhO family protein [Methanobrevibacter sp.]|uniref:YfhO family protein n=1 Tax=Methanobrevibacter sp. TaxID=66852 RepID=UPI00388F6F05
MKNKNHNLKLMFECFFVFLITALILLILFIINHYAPFGPNTLSALDANIQYRDFYAYFKDVLKGSNNISYYNFLAYGLPASGLAPLPTRTG